MSVEIDINTTDYDVKITNGLRINLPKFIPRTILEASHIIADQERIEVPVRIGKLRGSISEYITDTEAIISTNSGYGAPVDLGHRAFVLRARLANYLRFEIDGKVFFRKKVNIPARAGVHFRKRTLENASGRIVEMISRVYNDLF